MDVEQQASHNRQTVLQLIRDVTAVSLTHSVILQDVAQATTITGRAAVTAVLHSLFHTAFADQVVEPLTLCANEDTASACLTLSGRQIELFWGLPCTGRYITLSLRLTCRFYSDQIAHIELDYDAETLLRQVGLAL